MNSDSPNTEFLNREHVDGEQAETIKRIAILLDRDVNFGTHILGQIAAQKTLPLEQVVGFAMYRGAVEIHDAISVLVKEYIDAPSLILARSSFEMCLFIQYLTEDNTHERAIHYLQDELIDELKSCTRTIADFKNIENITEKYAVNTIRIHGPLAEKAKLAVKSKLESDLYKTSYTEYMRTKKDGKIRNPPWYSLNDGPRNIAQLAGLFNLKHYYAEVYSYKSRLSHGKSALQAFSKGNSDGPGVKRLRTGADILFPVRTARTMFNKSTENIFSLCLPDRIQEYHDWRIECHAESDWLGSLVFAEN